VLESGTMKVMFYILFFEVLAELTWLTGMLQHCSQNNSNKGLKSRKKTYMSQRCNSSARRTVGCPAWRWSHLWMISLAQKNENMQHYKKATCTSSHCVEWVMVDRTGSCKNNCFLSSFLGAGGSGYVGGYILLGTLICRAHNFLQLLDGTLNV
jgi:hypothetical protein